MSETFGAALPIWLKALIIGVAAAAPVGPVAVLCIRGTLAHGKIHGFLIGLGAAVADTIYAALASFGIGIVSEFMARQQCWLRLVGGIFLLLLGLRSFTKKYVKKEPRRGQDSPSHLRVFVSSLLITLTNPVTILAFVAVFAGLGMVVPNDSAATAFSIVAGVFAGAAAWWMFLAGASSLFRDSFDHVNLTRMHHVSGVILILFGAFILATLVFLK